LILIKKAENNNLKPVIINGDFAYGYIETSKNAESLDIKDSEDLLLFFWGFSKHSILFLPKT
jgi:hypothetical protein